MTFAIFLYAELQWNTAKDSAARVGFNDGNNFVYSGNTDKVIKNTLNFYLKDTLMHQS